MVYYQIFLSNTIGDISLHHSEIDARLRNISVYTFTDVNSALILLYGELRKPVCPFFTCKETAFSYLDKLQTNIPSKNLQIKKPKIIKIGLDQYYKCISVENYKNNKSNDCCYRIIPSSIDIDATFNIIEVSNITKAQHNSIIEGVPIFQIESLEATFKSDKIRVMPLFLSITDANFAVASAYTVKKKEGLITAKQAIIQTEKLIVKYLENAKVQTVPLMKQKCHNQMTILKSKIKKELNQFLKTKFLSNSFKIETGCLEWVIQNMEQDNTGVWTEVFIVTSCFNSI
jgi:hypothetical protein